MDEKLKNDTLRYHQQFPAGKLSVRPSKTIAVASDLALTYTPGVAAACLAIADSPEKAFDYTTKGNLVAVISNGTAVLGLGNIGPLASKPVMEGKSVLFKKFAGIDAFDIEIAENNPEKLTDIIASLEPTFGGMNLEDIKAPECFLVENQLKKRLNIPVFHDDQHGTAVVVTAALSNALEIAGKSLSNIRCVVSGAGAAAIATLNLLVHKGLNPDGLLVCDSKGVIHTQRSDLDEYKSRYAAKTNLRTLAEAIVGADSFIGLSSGGLLTGEMLKTMNKSPIVFALANPLPEILPPVAKEHCPDVIIATGRSDFANQVNNALCFPYMFRGALDVRTKQINSDMMVACSEALASLAKIDYAEQPVRFGPEYIVPKMLDDRLLYRLAPAVAKAAMHSGVASTPITDWNAYGDYLRLRIES